MIDEKAATQLSKFLSLVLRHRPETIGIRLDEQGWTPVDLLLQQLGAQGHATNREILDYIVASNNKKRFAFSEDGRFIRASQGHSVTIDHGYQPQQPPAVLYHGTARHSTASIFKTGLEKRKRHHVHLSADPDTARQVGSRHGSPVVLCVNAPAMYEQGHAFFLSDNGVWLCDHVPPAFLQLMHEPNE